MVLLRKEQAGSTSHGHVWPEAGAVLDVPEHDARELLRIPDGGFSEVEFSEVFDEDEQPGAVDEAPRPPVRRRKPRDEKTGDPNIITE